MMDIRRVNIVLGQHGKCILLFILYKYKLFMIENEAFAKAVAAYHVPEAIIIYSSEDTTSAIVARIRAITWMSLQ